MRSSMLRVRTCTFDGCGQQATERCFECGAWHCAEHLQVILVPTFAGSLRELLCGECVRAHEQTRDRYGAILFEGTEGALSAQGV